MLRINCIHFCEYGHCSHPSARQIFWPNKQCILGLGKDERIGSCRMQIKVEPPIGHSPPKPPPPEPPPFRKIGP